MNESESGPAGATALEDGLAAWEARLTGLERQAAALLGAVKRLRKAASEGALGAAPAAAEAVREAGTQLAGTLPGAIEAPGIDVAAAFASGAFTAELARAAEAAGVTLVQRDGRLTAPPVVLRLEARSQGVRIGRRLERRIRPSFLARQLRALQQRPSRFNAKTLLDRLFRVYEPAARARAPEWQAGRAGEGPLVPLAELHDALTVLPAAAADYPLEEFLLDVLRLDRQPDARGGRGQRFELGGSTGTKGGKRLTVYDEQGRPHDYFAIRFIQD